MIPSDKERKDELRRRAEDALQQSSARLDEMAADDVRLLVHELQVHQIELEMQNEELRITQDQLAAAHERYFDLFDLAPVGYLVLSDAGAIEEINLTGASLLGSDRTVLVGKKITSFIFEQDQDIYYLHHRRARDANEQQVCELRIRRKDNSIIFANLVIARMAEQGNPSNQMRIILRDVSQRKQAEEALQKSQRELLAARDELEKRVRDRTQELSNVNQDLVHEILEKEQVTQDLRESEEKLRAILIQEQAMRVQLVQSEKYSALARLVSTVTHELNNPLQTIQNCLYLLMDGEKNGVDPETRKFLDVASSEAARMSKLIQQLKETYNPAKFNTPQLFNTVELLQKVKIFLEPYLQQNHTVMQIPSDLEPVMINGIRDQIQQVWINLSMNAVEAMQPAGGSLTVDIISHQSSGQVAISFQDTGTGIPEENLSKVFEPFFSTKSEGTGLGLSICYEIIQSHGGKIVVSSRPGEGTTFTVWLPCLDH